MLIEINLLPQKERRKTAFIATLGSLAAILLLVCGIYIFQIQTIKSGIQDTEGQISMTQKLLDKASQTGNSANQANSVTQLKTAVSWAESYPIQTVPVMNQLTALLPERGFIQSFTYNESGTATISVQFDTSRDAAYFLNNLENSKWIADASLTSLTAAADPNSTSNKASVQPQQNTAASVPGVQNRQNNSGPLAKGNVTAAAGTAAAPPASAAAPVTGTGTVNSSSSTYLPRYIGQFELKLNKDYIKQTLNKNTATGEGAAGK